MALIQTYLQLLLRSANLPFGSLNYLHVEPLQLFTLHNCIFNLDEFILAVPQAEGNFLQFRKNFFFLKLFFQRCSELFLQFVCTAISSLYFFCLFASRVDYLPLHLLTDTFLQWHFDGGVVVGLVLAHVESIITIQQQEIRLQQQIRMFTEFENMLKKQAEKITKSVPLDLLGADSSSNDYSKTPQKFNINGREIEEKKLLAEGAFGFIWLAEDTISKQQFALKRVICMTQDKSKSALLEKSLMEKIPQSPYIVKYHGGTVLKHEGNLVVITLMQLCPGGNLFDMLEKRENKGIPEETVRTIASSVLQGLLTLHKAGFIHRDIKIENILIGKDNKMKICDFGSCTTEIIDFSRIPKSEYDLTKESIEAFTTPMYRPPEIVDPYLKYKVSGKADLWMLGCVLYTMCYFVHPFLDANAVGISGAVYKFPKYPQETKYQVSTKMQDYIRNFLTPNPEFRPPAQKMLEILNRWSELEYIPLNQEAKKLKKEQEEKEQEMRKLNEKVSRYEGDIPMEQLMRLQQKLKGNNQESFEKEKVSFINNKETQKISQGSSAIYHKPSATKMTYQSSSISSGQSKKPIISSPTQPVDIWSTAFTTAKSNPAPKLSTYSTETPGQSFDAFNQVFSSGKLGEGMGSEVNKPVNKNNGNFFQFFGEQASGSHSAIVPKQKSNKAKEVNLLDL